MTDDGLAALDGDWSDQPPALRAAFEFTRKVTLEPHALDDADVAALKKHWTDSQALEILFTVCGNNAMVRWTDALGIPQEKHRVYLTETSKESVERKSSLAPLVCKTDARPRVPARKEAEAALAAAAKRTPRFALVGDEETRKLLPADRSKGPIPAWVRLFARFPKQGLARAAMLRAAEDKGVLDKTLRARIAWVAARHDRAWYALGHARRRLLALGVKEDAIWEMDGDLKGFKEGERLALAMARKLTVTPAAITDDDIAGLRKHFKDKEVAEIVHFTTMAAFFDRWTETANLPLEARP
ncbi:MAG: hypothetical protein K2W96_17925 [Gemmataceae bacterium]|nr:hypothetical protein [Gemmataceae bacterium]